jgi:hypothetical protein
LNNIPPSIKTQTTSTEEKSTENASHGTLLERRKGSGSKLLLALKDLFSRTEKSSAKAAVTNAVPQATTESIKTENKKSDSVKSTPRDRVRIAYRQLLFVETSKAKAQSGGVGASEERKLSYEEKVSIFDSGIARLQRGENLKNREEEVLDAVLPQLEKAVQNGSLGESKKQELLSDLSKIKSDLTDLQIKSALKAAWQGS